MEKKPSINDKAAPAPPDITALGYRFIIQSLFWERGLEAAQIA